MDGKKVRKYCQDAGLNEEFNTLAKAAIHLRQCQIAIREALVSEEAIKIEGPRQDFIAAQFAWSEKREWFSQFIWKKKLPFTTEDLVPEEIANAMA